MNKTNKYSCLVSEVNEIESVVKEFSSMRAGSPESELMGHISGYFVPKLDLLKVFLGKTYPRKMPNRILPLVKGDLFCLHS